MVRGAVEGVGETVRGLHNRTAELVHVLPDEPIALHPHRAVADVIIGDRLSCDSINDGRFDFCRRHEAELILFPRFEGDAVDGRVTLGEDDGLDLIIGGARPNKLAVFVGVDAMVERVVSVPTGNLQGCARHGLSLAVDNLAGEEAGFLEKEFDALRGVGTDVGIDQARREAVMFDNQVRLSAGLDAEEESSLGIGFHRRDIVADLGVGIVANGGVGDRRAIRSADEAGDNGAAMEDDFRAAVCAIWIGG